SDRGTEAVGHGHLPSGLVVLAGSLRSRGDARTRRPGGVASRGAQNGVVPTHPEPARMIDHAGVTVSDFTVSKAFYTAALGVIGYAKLMEFGPELLWCL